MPATHTSAAVLDTVLLAAAYEPVATTPRVMPLGVFSTGHVDHGGFGRVFGTVKVKGTPNYAVARRVRLFRDRDGLCAGEVWSDPVTGAYEFLFVDPAERYTAIAYDHEHSFRAVVADNLTPEAYSG